MAQACPGHTRARHQPDTPGYAGERRTPMTETGRPGGDILAGLCTGCALLCLLAVLPCAQAASPPPIESATGLVVSAQRLASQAGVDVLRLGGNAIDAAVAVGYAE